MFTRTQISTLNKILDRAEELFKKYDINETRINTLMDLDNADDCVPLDWDALLTAADFDFAHDIFGIRQHMNRVNGKLEGCFLPRCALLADTDGSTGQF